MGDTLGKISSYNILNYLLPGVLFAAAADSLTSYTVVQDDTLIGLFLYYFIGLVISRLGSLLLEPFLEKVDFFVHTEHSSYVKASKTDPKLETLSEVNNMYRTLTSLFICLMVFMAFEKIVRWCPTVGLWAPYLSILALLSLFLYSWKKQTSYIVSRINTEQKK